MATQNLGATITGSGGVRRATITSPAYLMVSIDGAARVNALLGQSPLPGATMSGGSSLTATMLGLGHVLTLNAGLTFGGASVLANAVELTLSGSLTFGGVGGVMLDYPELYDVEGGLTTGGTLLLSTGPALLGLAA